jgi:DNA-binding NarL/FixJ family response regulator
MKIVIADDSFLLRDRIKFLLKSINNQSELYEAKNGLEAIYLILEVKPDLVILDIRMPEMNGIDVLKKIRESKMPVKICILTNYSHKLYRLKCFEAGADYFLSKTEDFDNINFIISDMLKGTVIPD